MATPDASHLHRPAASRLADGFIVSGSNISESYGAAYRGKRHPDDAKQWLCDTELLQHEHPRIRVQAAKLTQLKSGAREKALACHEFVRGLPFAIAADGAHTPSVEVLRARAGDCHTKSTLFIALLRSAGIPARARIVSLKPAYLQGILDTGGRPVEHCFTEVLLGGLWLGVDSYVIDLPLGLAARARLRQEGAARGWAVHARGQLTWNGRESSFGQFSCNDAASLPMADWGAFHDVAHFQQATACGGPLNWVVRQQLSLEAGLANRRIRKLRDALPRLAHELCDGRAGSPQGSAANPPRVNAA